MDAPEARARRAKSARTRRNLHRQGFDKVRASRSSPGYFIVGCSQCQALVINGTATHEHGCLNQRRA